MNICHSFRRISLLLKIRHVAGFLLFIFFNIPFITLAQENEFGGGIGGMFGVNLTNMNDLNDELLESGLVSLNPEKMFAGGMGYVIYNKFVFSPEGGAFWQTTSSGDVEIKYKGGLGFLNFGYIVISEPNSRGYPFIGIGRGGASMDFTSKMGEQIVFADEELDSGDSIDFNTLLVNLGFSVHFLINFSKNEKKKGGLMVGLRAGYIFTPGDKKWKHNGIEISGAPKATLNGVYARLILGGWGSKIF